MDIITTSDLRTLVETRGEFCLSLFLPTERVAETEQNPLRLKNLLREAEELLVAHGLRSPYTTRGMALLKPLQDLLPDRLFWAYQSDGLALFRSPDAFYVYRLPARFEELVVVGNRFHLKPLLPFLTGDGLFYILALSQNEIRLLEGTRYSIDRVALPSAVPESLADVLKYDDVEKQLQFHTGAPAGTYRGRAAIFHGHGGEGYSTKENLLRYFRQIDKGLQELLKGAQAPLVLAGVEYLFPFYHEANTYPHLLAEGVAGNPETWSNQELHARAWTVVEPFFRQGQQDAAARYNLAMHTRQASHLTLNEIKDIVPAAYQGRVSSLFIAQDLQFWGAFDPATQTAIVHQSAEPGDEDLVDFAAIETFLNNGTAYVVAPEEVPDPRHLAAVLRY